MAYNATRNGESVEAEPTGNVESHRGHHMAEFETDDGIDWAFVSEELKDELGDA